MGEKQSKVKIGVLGAGAISGIYFQNLTELFREVEVWAVCDLFREKAAERWGRPPMAVTWLAMEVQPQPSA